MNNLCRDFNQIIVLTAADYSISYFIGLTFASRNHLLLRNKKNVYSDLLQTECTRVD